MFRPRFAFLFTCVFALPGAANPPHDLLHLANQNEVRWEEWGEEAQAEARARNVPLFVAIGDPFSELTAAMHRESFANPVIATYLNRNFVCVLVSREHAPGLEAYGQQWFTSEQKPRGVPLNLWFTPELLPIEAAGYLPQVDDWGREALITVAKRVAESWESDPAGVVAKATALQRRLRDFDPLPLRPGINLDQALSAAADDWLTEYDANRGVFGRPRHHAEPELLRFLLQAGEEARLAALQALRVRLSSPLRDPLDGGFYRGTVDRDGNIPTFQKRMSDQARVALACLDAARLDPDPVFAAGARGALNYVLTRLANPDGTFRIGENATDRDMISTQTWRYGELVEEVGVEAAAALGARAAGNVDEHEDIEQLHHRRNILSASPMLELGEGAKRLLARRDRRAATITETDATVGEHAMLYLALRRAGRELDDARLADAAVALERALREEFAFDGRGARHLAHHDIPATPQDLLLLALATGDRKLARRVDERFLDERVGLFYATADEVLGVRPYNILLSAAELPSAVTLRVMIGHAPSSVADRIQGQLQNGGRLPAGPTLLAMQMLEVEVGQFLPQLEADRTLPRYGLVSEAR